MIRSAIFVLAAMQLAAKEPALPGPLIYTYSTALDKTLPQLPAGSVRTLSFSFSPDEQWIAVLAGVRATRHPAAGPPVGSTLLLIPFLSPASQPVRVDLGTPALVSGPYWSPDSKAVAVQGLLLTKPGALGRTPIPRVYNLRGEQIWSRRNSGAIVGFIAADQLLISKEIGKTTGFEIVNIRTDTVTPSGLNPGWRIAAIDPNKGRIAVYSDKDESRTLILDDAFGKILQSFKNHTAVTSGYPRGFPSQYFADNGNAICSIAYVWKYDARPECRDVSTGKIVATFESFEGGAPADVSARGSRMVLTDLHYFPGPGAYTFEGRVVWDFHTGSEVTAWKTPASPSVRFDQFPLLYIPRVAISSTGRYLVESLGGDLRIYDIH